MSLWAVVIGSVSIVRCSSRTCSVTPCIARARCVSAARIVPRWCTVRAFNMCRKRRASFERSAPTNNARAFRHGASYRGGPFAGEFRGFIVALGLLAFGVTAFSRFLNSTQPSTTTFWSEAGAAARTNERGFVGGLGMNRWVTGNAGKYEWLRVIAVYNTCF